MRIALLATFVAMTAAPAVAQQPIEQPRTVNVNATGTVQRAPEKAVITVAVESSARTAREAAQANATKMDAVFSALRSLGIVPPKVRTISYELHPEYAQPTRENPNPTLRVTGYRAINMVLVDVDSIGRVGAVIDGVVSAGANRIANLSFELRDNEMARLEALRIAMARAHAEATALANAAGQRLGHPLNISSSSHYEPRQYRMEARADMAMAPAPPPTPIESGMLTLTANVSVSYRLEDR